MPLYERIGVINEKKAVVLEFGNVFTKIGFAGDSAPRSIIRSYVPWEPAPPSTLMKLNDEKILHDRLVEFIRHIYTRFLPVTPKDRKVVIVESIFIPTSWKQVLAKVLYLHFEIPNVLWLPSHLAAICTTGSDTGLVVEIGSEECFIIPVFKGVTLLSKCIIHELGAKVFDSTLKNCILKNYKAHGQLSPDDLEGYLTPRVLEDIRVKSCIVANYNRRKLLQSGNFDELNPRLKSFDYKFDGKTSIELDGVVRELPAEIWFQTEDLDGASLPQMIIDVIKSCPIDSRKILAQSVLLTGGLSMIPNLKGRLVRELNKLAEDTNFLNFPEKFSFKIFSLPVSGICANWLGGAVYGVTEALSTREVSKETFQKYGHVYDWYLQNCTNADIFASNISNINSPFNIGKGL